MICVQCTIKISWLNSEANCNSSRVKETTKAAPSSMTSIKSERQGQESVLKKKNMYTTNSVSRVKKSYCYIIGIVLPTINHKKMDEQQHKDVVPVAFALYSYLLDVCIMVACIPLYMGWGGVISQKNKQYETKLRWRFGWTFGPEVKCPHHIFSFDNY